MKTLNTQNDRRSFLKKAAYVVPTVMGLGYLIQPTETSAQGRKGGGKSYVASNRSCGSAFKRFQNNGWGNGDDTAPGRSRFKNNAENRDRNWHHIHGDAVPN